MKKTLQIAKYDFKRLMFNPITLIVLGVILLLCMICGFAIQIPTTESLSATYQGTTTKAVYTSFSTSTSVDFDSKKKLDSYITTAENYIELQQKSNDEVSQLQALNSITKYINENNILKELEKIKINEDLSKQNEVYNYLQTLSNNLKTFVDEFKNVKEFETRLVLSKEQYQILSNSSKYLHDELSSSKTIETKLKEIADNNGYILQILEVSSGKNLITLDRSTLEEFKTKYVETAKVKLLKIENEMKELSNKVTDTNTSDLQTMKNYIKEYKLVCTSTVSAILSEYKIILERLYSNYGTFFNYTYKPSEDLKQDLITAQFHITSENLEYIDYQQPLNFGKASSKVTAYDHSYMIVSIIGFLTVLFGMFCAYKLYGRDRKNGKLDILLAQKVSFAQVFAGKFIAIIFCTMFCLASFALLSFIWGSILYSFLPSSIFAVFNLQSAYTIHPLLFLILKILGIELQVIFWAVVTIFAMNVSRKFKVSYAVVTIVFTIATIFNILFNGQLWYCLFPFIHADLTSYLGGATMQTGFLVTSLYSFGSFYISLAYYLVVIALLYNFTKQLFKKN